MIVRASAVARRAISTEALVHAFARHAPEDVVREAAIGLNVLHTELKAEFEALFLDTLRAAGQASAFQVRRARSFRAFAKAPSFDPGSAAERWASKRAGELIDDITKAGHRTVRQAVSAVFDDQLTPTQAAREIKSVIGLTEAQATAVQNLRITLEDADGTTISTFGGRLTIRVPEGGLSDDAIESWTDKYADRLLGFRAESIAETEIVAAREEGQRQFWEQAQDDGLLSTDARRVWDAGDEFCPVCGDLDGQEVGIRESFEGPDGEELSGPPAHTRCDCTQGISDAQEES